MQLMAIGKLAELRTILVTFARIIWVGGSSIVIVTISSQPIQAATDAEGSAKKSRNPT